MKIAVIFVVALALYKANASDSSDASDDLPRGCTCTREYNPMCGSDGLTYSNPCLLNCARKRKFDLVLAFPGTCKQFTFDLPCYCPYEYDPICGSDGTTYPNKCSMECQKAGSPGLQLQHEGHCPTEDSSEEEDQPCECSRDRKPVCGSDGRTYSNECVLGCHARTKTDLTVKRAGACSQEIRVAALPLISFCPCPSIFQPVCATDGTTYNNLCLLECMGQHLPIEFRHQGPCSEIRRNEKRDTECNCGKIYMPMCGSDGKTYGNPCMLECSRNNNPAIRAVNLGECSNDSDGWQ